MARDVPRISVALLPHSQLCVDCVYISEYIPGFYGSGQAGSHSENTMPSDKVTLNLRASWMYDNAGV